MTWWKIGQRSKAAPTVPSKSSQQTALEDAEIACAYAAESGMPLPESSIGHVIAFRRAFDAKTVPADVERAFWAAAAEIAGKIRPVTMDALRARSEYRQDAGRSSIGAVVRRYHRRIWIVLLVTLCVHSYQALVEGSLSGAREAAARFDAARLTMRTLNLAEIEAAEDATQIASTAPVPTGSPPAWTVLNGRQLERVAEFDIQRQLMCSAVRDWGAEAGLLGKITPPVADWLVAMIAGSRDLVLRLGGGAARGLDGGQGFLPSALDPSSRAAQLNLSIGAGGPTPGIPEETDPSFVKTHYGCGEHARPVILVDKDVTTLVAEFRAARLIGLGSVQGWDAVRTAEDARSTLAAFILPCLYGLLGAMASVVRSVSLAVTSVTFVPASRVLYTLRLPLGALAGATVGLLFDPKSLASVEGLTSLGVAFGFGYAVEVFFAAIDGLVRRLIGPRAGDEAGGQAAGRAPA